MYRPRPGTRRSPRGGLFRGSLRGSRPGSRPEIRSLLDSLHRSNRDLRSGSHPRNDRSKAIPIAKGFEAYLEENQLKETMTRSKLRDIYIGDFSTEHETNGVHFGDALNAMSFHLNLCQQIRGKVIFGSGEEAALAMLDSDDDDDDWEKEVHSYPCNTCRKPMPSRHALEKHHSSINHRQQMIFKTIRETLERQELILDKRGIEVTSSPEGDGQSGVIETVVPLGDRETIVLTVRNTGLPHRVVYLKDITLLWSTSLFDYTDIREIPSYKSVIARGTQELFSIGCKPKEEYGFSYVPVVLRFNTQDNENNFFYQDDENNYIMRFLCIRSVSDIYDDLKKTSEYIGPAKHQVVPSDITTEPGLQLPPLRRNELFEEPLENYFVVDAVKEDVRGPNKLSEYSIIRFKVELKLAFRSYKQKFSTLIQIEELQMEKDIRNNDMQGETFTKDGRFLILTVPGLAENRPSVLRGDRILAYEQGLCNRCFEGIVHNVDKLNVKLGFGESMPFISGKKFDIQFTFNRMSIQMQHRAHERVVKNPGLEHVLFPNLATISTQGSNNIAISSYYDRYLNNEQKTAVNNITNGTSRPAPYLVFGPPGTGKTVTFVEAIKQVYDHQPNAVILACAPENSAADLIVERLLANSRIEKRKILRMYATSRPWEFVPQVLKDGKVINFNDKEVFYPTVEEMKDYRVIVTTLVTAGRLVSAQLGNNHFTHIFIDEAGHAVEPECVIPIADLLNPISGQLVLAGDPKQLGPVLRSPIGQKNGLGLSLLERLMTTCDVYKRSSEPQQYNDKVMTKLVNNYRSHRDIIEIPKQLFYDDELNECAEDFRNIMLGWEELPNPDCPIIIHPVYGTDEREARSPSFFNVAEVETIEKYLRKLLDDNVRSKRMKMIRPEMIGIISPYKRQVQKIQTMLEKKNFKNIKVGSVEEFQGQERRIIIVSTVRSTKREYLDMDKEFGLGFLDNPKRFNVAITRAQALLILIGNTEMLNRDDNWSRFLMFCCDKGAFVKTVQMKQEGNDIASLMKRLGLLSQNALPEDNSDISMRELQESPEWTRHE